MFFSPVLAKKYRATDGDLAACRTAKGYCNKKHGGILLLLANNYKAKEGDLAHAELRSGTAIPEKIHGGILLLLANECIATDVFFPPYLPRNIEPRMAT